MPRVALPEGVSVNCSVDDFLWPWNDSTPVLMMHGSRTTLCSGTDGCRRSRTRTGFTALTCWAAVSRTSRPLATVTH
jgi:hypothetical protein